MLITIWDTKANLNANTRFLTLHDHIATAIRDFQDLANDKNTIVGKHLPDFDLVQIGWLTEQGQLETDWNILMSGKALAEITPSTPVEVPSNLRKL